MSDLQEAPGDTGGNTGFADEWERLAREDQGQAATAPSDSETRHEIALQEKQDGQGGGDAAPPSEAAPSGPAPGEKANDIWADAPAHLREAFRLSEEAREKAENAVRSNNGRVSKAEREAAALRARIAAQANGQAPQRQEAPAPDPALRERLVGDYEEAVAPLADEVISLRQTVARLEAQSASAADQEAARNQLELAEFLQAEEGKLVEAHPDWAEVALEPAFVQWVQSGPQFIRDGIARNANGIVDGAEATAILDLFKRETGRVAADDPTVAKRRRQLEGNRAVPARSPGATPAGSPDDYDAEWARLAEIDRRASAPR